MLNPSGSAIGRALANTMISTDIDDVPRPAGKSSDIGAREYTGIKITPDSNRGSLPKKWLFMGVCILLFSAFLLAFLNRRRSKGGKSDFLFSGDNNQR
jgi:hypothetical protein